MVHVFIAGLTLICCSDSDSEMETRIKEAAVSIEDLLPSTAVLASLQYGQIKENVVEEKKKKRPPECTDAVSGQSEKDVQVKVKRKKKRRAAKEEATT